MLSKIEATTAFKKLHDDGVSQFHVTFALEPILTATLKQHNTREAALFAPNTKWNELASNDLNCVCVNDTI